MADKTIAYSNRGGFWKTRYSFFSSCYAFVDRCLISFNKAFSNNPVWKHDDNPQRTSFYGVTGGSGIAVTFNAAPSQNKLYKAFSLESTNNVSGLNTFLVNNSSVASQTKNIQSGLLQERGGIMYGHIGRETIALGANTNILGQITAANITNFVAAPSFGFTQAITVEYTIDFIDGSQNNLIYSDDFPSKLFMYWPEAQDSGVLTDNFFAGWTDTPVDGNGFSSYQNMPSGMVVESLTGNVLTLTLSFSTAEGYNQYIDSNNIGQGFVDVVGEYNFILYSMSAESINGEDPKGQTVDAVITLGSDPYELYALNVEYSPTDLDHSK